MSNRQTIAQKVKPDSDQVLSAVSFSCTMSILGYTTSVLERL